MLSPEDAKELYKKDEKEAAGAKYESYLKKLEQLKKIWANRDDSEETRIIASVVLHYTTPINISIISDNLEYFKKNMKKEEMDPELALARACLCGSREIAEYLFKELNYDYLSSEGDYILGYVSASPNIEWAKEIAHKVAQSKKEMPKAIFRLASDDKVISTIQIIFKEEKSKFKNRQ